LKEEKEMEVKIYYDGGLNVELDRIFEDALKPLGLHRWASGMNMETKERDLAFTTRKEKENNAQDHD